MKKLILALALVLASCAGKPQYVFNEGPARIDCKADSLFAQVDKPWPWSCTIAGNLAPYEQSVIGIEIITSGRELWPQRSVVGEGLKRVYAYESIFDEEYYLDLTGHAVINEEDILGRPEIISPDDPTYPAEPIEGIEASLNGDFYLEVRFVEIVDYNVVTGEATIKDLGRSRVRGRLSCPRCSV